MQRMSGIDPMFFYSETAAAPMEVAYACVFDPSTAPHGYSFDAVRRHVERRLPELAPFRRRCVEVPLGLDHPRWVDDPDFDLDDHVRRTRLPAPGDASVFRDFVAEVMARKLDPDAPPWEVSVVEGLEDDKVGVVAKVHHSLVDGVSGSAILAKLLDPTPAVPDEEAGEDDWSPHSAPTPAELVRAALPDVLAQPLRAARAAGEVARTTVRLARHVVAGGVDALSLPLGAPAQFSRPLLPERSVSFAQLSMRDIRTLREYAGVSVNDVVLAVCSGALRSYLSSHDSFTSGPLIAVVPVSVRDLHRDGDSGNRLSAMFVPLADGVEHPLERLRSIALSCSAAKAQERSVGYGELASAMADALPPAIARPALRLGNRLGAVRHLRPANLVVSNVPGATCPLYFAGMRMVGIYPLGPVVDGIALNITVQSYVETLFVGLNACPAAVPDTELLARAVEDEMSVLAKAAGEAGLHCAKGLVEREGAPTSNTGEPRPMLAAGSAEEGASPPLVVSRPINFGVPSLR